MATLLVLAQEAQRLWTGLRPGDLVGYPFGTDRVRVVQEVFPSGDVALSDYEAAKAETRRPKKAKAAPPAESH